MREIKFRIWNNHAEEIAYNEFWVNGSSIVYDDGKSYNDRELDNDLVVMQYTGLKDKNEKDIYEGDILKNESEAPTNIIERGVVVFDGGGFMMAEKKQKGALGYYLHKLSCVEIIGNIYQNPELLTK